MASGNSRPRDLTGRCLPGAQPPEVVLVHGRHHLESGFGREFTQPFAAIAILADFEIDGRHASRDRCAHQQARELGARDLDVLVQLFELRGDLRQLPHAQRLLALIALELDWLQSAVVVELVLQGVARLPGIRRQRLAPVQRTRKAHHVVLDTRELLQVVEPILLERRLPFLQLRDGFDEPRFAIEHHQLELGIAEADQRLVLHHHVSGFHQYLLYPPAFDGIQIDSVARHDPRAQRNEVVESAARHGADGELVALDPQMAFAVEQRGRAAHTRRAPKWWRRRPSTATGATTAAEQGCPCC